MKLAGHFLLIVFLIIALLIIAVRLRYGGGQAYPDLSGQPKLSSDEIEQAAILDQPPAI